MAPYALIAYAVVVAARVDRHAVTDINADVTGLIQTETVDVGDAAGHRTAIVGVEGLCVADTITARIGIDQTGAVNRARGGTAVYIAPFGVVGVQRPFRQTNARAGC